MHFKTFEVVKKCNKNRQSALHKFPSGIFHTATLEHYSCYRKFGSRLLLDVIDRLSFEAGPNIPKQIQ